MRNMVNINKTHIWNVTYMGIGIYDEIMSRKETLLASMGEEMYIKLDMGIFAKDVKGDIKEQSIASINSKPAVIKNQYLIDAIKRGTIERYGGHMGKRDCTPLMNKWAQQLHEDHLAVLEEFRMEWALSHSGEFEHPNENDFTGSSAYDKPIVNFTQPRATYYFDSKGRMGYKDDRINTNFNTSSEECDPLSGNMTDDALMYKIMRNRRARKLGLYSKDKCLACGEIFERKSPNSNQMYCDKCKPMIKNIQSKEKIALVRDLRGQQGIVPSRDNLFEKYAEHAWVGTANGKSIMHHAIDKGSLVKTSEAKPRGHKPERADIEPCECGNIKFQSYKPWKPEIEGGKYGKIGSTILYCPKCGLVVDQKPMRSYPEQNVEE
jgi:hypothetical protein